MSNNNTKDEHMEIYIKTRNKILFELQQAYKNNSYQLSSTIDSSTCNEPKSNEKLCSPVVDDLLMEMNRGRLRNLEKNNDTHCYRCKHFLNVPPNLSDIYKRISSCAEEYEADLNFVQAIVWLKSATTSLKDVSIEQFHLIFHKQWSNNRDTRKDSEHQNSITRTQEYDRESLNSTIRLNDTQENNISFNSNSECTNSINLLCNVQKEKHNLSQSNDPSKEDKETFIEDVYSSSIFNSILSLEKSFSTQNYSQNKKILKNCIIPDSEGSCSSSSDMFDDSSSNEDYDNPPWDRKDEKLLQEDELITDNSIGELSLTSQISNLSTKRDIPITLDKQLSSASDILFNEDFNFLDKYNTIEQINRASDLSLHNKNRAASANWIDNEDNDESRSDCVLQNEDINVFSDKKLDIITPYYKDSAYDTYDLENHSTNLIPEEDRLLSLSSRYKSDQSVNQIGIDYEASSSSGTEADKIDGEVNKNKKRKVEGSSDAEKEIPKKKNKFFDEKEKEERISSKWLRFTLDALNADDVAFQSVKIILSVLQDDRIARRYMKKKCWRNTLEEQAVIAVLNFCDVFEDERRTTACTQEIVQTVTNTLDESVKNAELNKVTLLTHRMSIILELCNSAKICIETINYLTDKLKSYESILIALMNGKKADVHNIINELHMVFYALNVCLQKYRLMFPDEQHSQLEEETIPSVVDLWKKQLTFEDVTIKESLKTRERRWLIILDDFMAISIEYCSQFAEKLRTLIDLITRE